MDSKPNYSIHSWDYILVLTRLLARRPRSTSRVDRKGVGACIYLLFALLLFKQSLQNCQFISSKHLAISVKTTQPSFSLFAQPLLVMDNLPPGIVPNYVDPPDHIRQTIILHTLCLTLVTLAVAMRTWTRLTITKGFGLDDCRTPQLPGSFQPFA